jgi:AcrR family transcriptional regulator
MARPRQIEPDRILDAAERVVAEKGAGALSIGSVAKEAGVSKGGVQSVFGTKEGLLAGMLERWIAADDRRFEAALTREGGSADRALAHILATQSTDEDLLAKSASLLAVLVQSPAHLAQVRSWYARRLGDLQVPGRQARAERLALLAAEGAFFLRFLGFVPIAPETWEDIFQDIRQLASRE